MLSLCLTIPYGATVALGGTFIALTLLECMGLVRLMPCLPGRCQSQLPTTHCASSPSTASGYVNPTYALSPSFRIPPPLF